LDAEREHYAELNTPSLHPPRSARRWRIGCLLLAGLLLVLIVNEWLIRPLLNPLRRSADAIAADLQQKMPLGTPRSEVQAWVNAQGWPQGGITGGSDGGPPPILRSLGRYETYGMLIDVFAEWWFGPDGRLESVVVHKWCGNAL
jgi:hypothetical protein